MRKVIGMIVNDFASTFSGDEVDLRFFETTAEEIKDAGFMGYTKKEIIDNFADFITDKDFSDSIVAYDRVRGKDLMGSDFTGYEHIDGLSVDGMKYFL